ncbi:MAG TPA: FGGY-family carbohydrate kinase [Candidatus Dormibacteraeota bacterium]|nr:FGGY-family carbohydrate kinase [Candidatus Dormibacteraeota bacterium]
MPEPWILGIDLGTGGLKVGAVSLRGELLGHAVSAVNTTYLPERGAVQDTAEWWHQIRSGVRATLSSRDVGADDLVGVGITGQWGSTVPVGADGRAVADCRLWSDTRGGRFSARAVGGTLSLFGYSPGNILRWVQLTGGAPSPHGADPLGHELYMRNCEPELYAVTRWLLEPVDYLGLLLTGRAVATPASMILSWLTDNRPGASVAYVPELVRRCGRDPGKLPSLVPTGSVIGPVLPGVAEELGIPSVPVVAGVPDLHTAFLGSGAVAPFDAHITISTSAWISCEVPFKRTDVMHQMASVPGVRQGMYLVANNHETAGLCFKWLRDSILGGDFDELCRSAESVPAGSDGVMFTPWLNGERTPVEDRTLRAAFLNVSVATGRAHFVRAVLEGVAFNARWLLDAVEKFVGRSLPSLRILGGGAQSDLWCQIHADVLGRRIERVAEPMYGSLRGAGLFAAIALGKLTVDEVHGAVRITDVFEPDEQSRKVYEPMYAEFKRFYGVLHGSYARLNR